MPRLYNLDHQPVVVDHSKPAVQPGESYVFTDEQVEAGIAGVWGEEDPRKGLEEEQAFKRRRDKKPAAKPETPDPAEPDAKE